MTDMAIDLKKPILDFVRNMVIPAERAQSPDFSEKSIDNSFYTMGDDYWKELKTPPNGKLDFQEGLNFALFKYDRKAMTDVYAGKIESSLGIDVPWYISPEEMKDPVIARKVQAIDRAISILDSMCRNASRAEYERKMAIGLYAFLMHVPAEKGMIEKDISELLRGIGLADFAYAIAGLLRGQINCDEQICGLNAYEITKDRKIEIPVSDLLKNNRGECTELSYLYAFAARRAGIKVGFAVASTSMDGDSNHQYNVVYLSDGTVLSVDMALAKVNGDYAKMRKIDYHQALANYYRNKAKVQDMVKGYEDVVDRYYQIALSLDPDDSYTHQNYATFLHRNECSVEAHRHFDMALRHGGERSISIRFNIGTTLIKDEKGEGAKAHLQFVYDNLKSAMGKHLDKYNDDQSAVDGYFMYATAARHLGKLDDALSYYRRAIEIDTARPELFIGYAETLRIRGGGSSFMEAKGIYEALMDLTIEDQHDARSAALGYLSLISDMQQSGLLFKADVDKAYELVSKKQPNSIGVLYNYMVLLLDAGRYEECLGIAEQVTKLPSTGRNANIVSAAFEVRAELLLKKGDAAGASIIYEKLLATKDDDAVTHFNYGICLQKMAFREADRTKSEELLNRAEEHLRKACRLNPTIDPNCQRL